MPIYTPTYFPPAQANGSILGATAGLSSIGARRFLAGKSAGNNGVADDLIVIGHLAVDAGAPAGAAGSVVVGSLAVSGAVAYTTGPAVVVGVSALGLAATADIGGSVLVGSHILAADDGATGTRAKNTLIGHDIAALADTIDTFHSSVCVGYHAAYLPSDFPTEVTDSVLLGSEVFGAAGGTQVQIRTTVAIGASCARVTNFSAGCVFIGYNCQNSLDVFDTLDSVVIGAGAAFTDSNLGEPGGTVLIGANASVDQSNNSVIIGCNAIGETAVHGQLLIETLNGALIYGSFNDGNALLGKSTAASGFRNFGTGATNILKMLNGTIGDATTRAGGGYFYVAAGALHWVGSAGTDTVVALA